MKFWEQPKRVRNAVRRKKHALEIKVNALDIRINDLEAWLGELKRNKQHAQTELAILRENYNLSK